MGSMNRGAARGVWAAVVGLLMMLIGTPAKAEISAAGNAAFDAYVGAVEARLAKEHAQPGGFLEGLEADRLRRGEMVIENVGNKEVSGAMLHGWRGTAFVPGATAAEFERMVRDFGEYPKWFSPQVVMARVLEQRGDRYRVLMRLRQKHVITVVLDTTYDIVFSRQGPMRGSSASRSIDVKEIDDAGSAKERALGPDEEHGFLWRQNTYWTYEQRDGGLYMQVQSVSLTRKVPVGLGWVLRPYIESVPRESLEFTLGKMKEALETGNRD